MPIKPLPTALSTALPTTLPIEAVLEPLKQQLALHHEVILEAPPGAGKTTLVPLALLNEAWLTQNGQAKKILLLEPRRIATRSAALRMAELLNEQPGQTVGYRMRLDTKISRATRIEVITEGILTRMLQSDPSLEDVGLVIFDEYHERSLDSDLALSLCLKTRELFRTDDAAPLKLIVMSATLDGPKTSKLLNQAPVIKSEGKQYPVDIVYGRASQPRERIVDRVVSTVKQALNDHPESNLLVFLPGQGEIRRCAEQLNTWRSNQQLRDLLILPLHGGLAFSDQQHAIAPLTGKQQHCRKVVLSTNIAETSLTIEGVDIVIDAGLAREPVFDPATSMTRLETVRISKSASIQRSGRAGRLRAGTCYRLWSSDQQQQLASHISPEIQNADLASLALALLQWGIDSPQELTWMDAPPKGAWQQAIDLLKALDAVESKTEGLILSQHGQSMATLPVHPRLAHLLLTGANFGIANTAALIASLLSDRDPFSQDRPDIQFRLDLLMGEAKCPPRHLGWLQRTRTLAGQFEQQLAKLPGVSNTAKQSNNGANSLPIARAASLPRDQSLGFLLACAYPDRIARKRHSGGYQLANGRSVNFFSANALAKHRWLVIADAGGKAGGKGDIIRSAAPLDPELFSQHLSYIVKSHSIADWDKQTKRFVAEQQACIGALVLHRKQLTQVPPQAKRDALIRHIEKQGLALLPFSAEIKNWLARVQLLHQTLGSEWPDVSNDNLLQTLNSWLGPYLDNVNLLNDFKKLDLQQIFSDLLSWQQQQQLNELAPQRLQVPSGAAIQINYNESPPVLGVKLQEMFGCEQTPTIVRGQVSLLIHLLSPAGRPLQVTQDLAGFWRGAYQDVKKEMKGRYPKHPWPDDPLTALPTAKTKARLK